MTSTGTPGRERAEQDAEAEWRGTLRTLLRENPELVKAVRAEVENTVTIEWCDEPTSVRQVAFVRSGVSIQSGRDTSIV
ncbi:MAG: hypothetical protein ACR2GH_20830 [Pseudonocardia sp.]